MTIGTLTRKIDPAQKCAMSSPPVTGLSSFGREAWGQGHDVLDGLTAHTYIQQTRESIDVSDILSSLVKAVVFAALIAGIGCQRGFQVSGDAASVGRSTTSAVVSAIFLIIVADSAFAIVLHYLG